MSVTVRSALPAIGILAATLSLPIPLNTANADTCLTAPKGAAPEGGHWYYRIERPSLRKCWRLVQKGQKEQTAVRDAPQPDDEAETRPASAASAPTPRMALPDVRPALEPVIRNLVTRNVSNPSEPAQPLPLPPPEPAASAMPRAENAPAAQDQAKSTEPAPAAAVQQPIVAADAIADAANADGAPTLALLLAALALLGLVAGGAFLAMGIVRRRTDVLNTMQHADAPGFEAPHDEVPDEELPDDALPVVDAPTFAPLPPMAEMPREDDVDAALRRFRENMRRRAA